MLCIQPALIIAGFSQLLRCCLGGGCHYKSARGRAADAHQPEAWGEAVVGLFWLHSAVAHEVGDAPPCLGGRVHIQEQLHLAHLLSALPPKRIEKLVKMSQV